MQGRIRHNIAFFGDNVFDGFEGPIWSSVAYTAHRYNLNLFSFASGPISSWYRNSFEKLISPLYLDGIISISGTLGCHSPDDELEAFYRHFTPLPIVGISREVRGTYSILVNNETGILQLMDHLMADHHYRRIAFICGPANNTEAILRLNAYRESLRRYGMAYDENLVYYGDFFWEGGKQAINTFIDERHLQFDAVVAANDYMAIFAIRELRRRGYRVPEDIAVVGFDDMEESETMDLTTVKQPLTELGTESVRLMASLLAGEVPNERSLYLPTVLVHRGSCGCSGTDALDYSLFTSKGRDTEATTCLNEQIVDRLNRQFPEFAERMGVNWAGELLNSLDNEDESAFLGALDKGIRAGYDLDLKIYSWYDILQVIEENHPCFRHPQKRKTWIRDGFKFIGRLTYEFKENEQRLYYVLNSFEDSFGVLSWFKEYLPQLKIGNYFIARYEDNDKSMARLLDYHYEKGCFDLESKPEVFRTDTLVPGGFPRDGERYSYYVLPVMQLGYSLFEVSHLEKPAYYSFIGQISSAIKQTSLTHEVMQYASTLEQKVSERTKELKETQGRLLESARQAGMAEIAVNVLHNIGNILNSASISMEEIRNILNKPVFDGLQKVNEMLAGHREDLGGFFADDSRARLLPEYISKTSERITLRETSLAQEVEQVNEQMKLIHETINMLQDYARNDLDETFKERINLASVIDGALRIQAIYLQKNGVRVEKHIDDIVACGIEKNKLTHVLVNLIKNAVEAMEKTPLMERRISINALNTSEYEVKIEITDCGEGIPAEQLTKIFRYGFTTKANGHGFGLHTCANYINAMGGTLTAQSEGDGKGATFALTLPLKK